MKNSISAATRPLKSIIFASYHRVVEEKIMLYAGSLAYKTILSIIPLFAVSFSIFKAFGGMDKIYDRIRPMVLANLAEGASEQAMSKIETLINNAHTGAIGIGGFIALIFTSMTLLSDAEKALLAVWREKISRTLFQRFCTYWVFISLGPVALSVIVGAMSGTHLTVTRMLPSGTGLMLATTAFFFLVYKFIPKSKVNWNAALGGAICTASLWTGARGVYSIYVKNVVNYDKIYGSLGAIPIILVWIWMSWVIVLLGSSLAYSIQEYLKKQTHAR